MVQAKGVLPNKSDDREVLYRNPATCGYFIGVTVNAAGEPELRAWLESVDRAVDALVARQDPSEDFPQGRKVARVAVGLAPAFFDKLQAAGITVERPAGFSAEAAPATDLFGGHPRSAADVLFYVASTEEARAKEFLTAVADSSVVTGVTMERGYQRPDESEPFGYRDGVRNVRDSDRLRVVYVHTEGGQPEEPRWADGGTYMVNMKIAQNRAAFSSLPDDGTRDTVIGRLKDGTRLDLKGANDDPHEEPSDVPELLPPNAHVRKAGPRGQHDDTEIFRRGLPYADVVNGRVEVGLHFCSFQATAAQFDTVFNDWMLNQLFPQRPDGSIPGIDALMSTATAHGPLVEVRHAGIFFVPPYDQDGLAAALTAAAGPSRRRTGRLAINKVVVSPGNPGKRFERGGFTFEVRDSAGKTTVPNSQFTTQTNGRGVCQADLTVGETYQLVEVSTPRPVEPTEPIIFSMDKPNKHLRVENRIVEPNPGYTV